MEFFFFILPAVAVLGFLLASYFDFKTREIPPKLSHSLIAIGLIGNAALSFLTQNVLYVVQSTVFCVLCFSFSYALYKKGVWAGGDVKLFTALGALLPAFGALQLFPFLALAASLLAVFPFLIMYAAYHLLKQRELREKVRDDFRVWTKRSVYAPFYIIAAFFISLLAGLHWIFIVPISAVFFKAKVYAIPFVTFFSLWAFYDNFGFFAGYFIYILLISALVFLGIASFRALRDNVLRETVKIKNLEEGMIPAEEITLEGVKISPRNARGLTDEERDALRKSDLKKIVVKKTIPFTPVLTLGVIMLILFEAII